MPLSDFPEMDFQLESCLPYWWHVQFPLPAIQLSTRVNNSNKICRSKILAAGHRSSSKPTSSPSKFTIGFKLA
jgi:hypothetical protein